jgi:carboxyl-terminal processing protease
MDEQRPEKTSVSRQYTVGAVAALLMIGSFVGGVFLGELRVKPLGADAGRPVITNVNEPPPFPYEDVDFMQFWEVWKTIKERYVKQPVQDISLFYGALEGLVGSLEDPYSVYFDPEFAEKFAAELEGTFEGIGAEIGIKNDRVTVIAPLPGTPAERAGLKAGDKIFAIDDVDTTGMIIEDAVTRIRGPKGTEVKLLIGRDGFTEAQEILITRATITVEPVKWKTVESRGKKYAVLTISHFNEQTESKFNQAVRDLLIEDPAGLILDLRNNPGGFLDTAVKVAGEWSPGQTIVIERFSDGKEQKYNADGPIGRLAGMPTVVLVNGGSASASEIVAGALKDHGKATIVGEKTYGKGSVQDYLEYGDGSALKLSVALWLTPSGLSIEKEGIAPDIEVKMTPEDYNADKDPQMDKALEILSTPLPPTTGQGQGGTL